VVNCATLRQVDLSRSDVKVQKALIDPLARLVYDGGAKDTEKRPV
jgi:hypothetical protein